MKKSIIIVPVLFVLFVVIVILTLPNFFNENKEKIFFAAAFAQLGSIGAWIYGLYADQVTKDLSKKEKISYFIECLKQELEINENLLINFATLVKNRGCLGDMGKVPFSHEIFKQITSDTDCIAELKNRAILDKLWKYETVLRIMKKNKEFMYYREFISNFYGKSIENRELEELIKISKEICNEL